MTWMCNQFEILKRLEFVQELDDALSVGRYQDGPATDGAGGVLGQPAVYAVYVVLVGAGKLP